MGEGGCLVEVSASNQQLQRQHATVAARGRGRCCSPSPPACSCVLPVACRRQRPKHDERNCCTGAADLQRCLHHGCQRPLALRLGPNCNSCPSPPHLPFPQAAAQHHVTPSCSLPIVYPATRPAAAPQCAPAARRQRLGGCCHWHCLLPRRVLQPSVQPIVTRPEHSASACARQHMQQVLCRRRHSLLHADHLLLFLLRLRVTIH